MRFFSSLLALTLCVLIVNAAAPPFVPPPLPPEFKDYRTVDAAVRTKVGAIAPLAAKAQASYLGVASESKDGKLVITAVEADSPAERAGLLSGDVILKV